MNGTKGKCVWDFPGIDFENITTRLRKIINTNFSFRNFPTQYNKSV